MGYQTAYKLSCSSPGLVKEIVNSEKFEELSYAIDEDGDTNDAIKWYDHENDMRNMSECYKGVLFTLEGEGEDAGDIWRKYFLDGKMQHCPVKLEFDPFDSSKLK